MKNVEIVFEESQVQDVGRQVDDAIIKYTKAVRNSTFALVRQEFPLSPMYKFKSYTNSGQVNEELADLYRKLFKDDMPGYVYKLVMSDNAAEKNVNPNHASIAASLHDANYQLFFNVRLEEAVTEAIKVVHYSFDSREQVMALPSINEIENNLSEIQGSPVSVFAQRNMSRVDGSIVAGRMQFVGSGHIDPIAETGGAMVMADFCTSFLHYKNGMVRVLMKSDSFESVYPNLKYHHVTNLATDVGQLYSAYVSRIKDVIAKFGLTHNGSDFSNVLAGALNADVRGVFIARIAKTMVSLFEGVATKMVVINGVRVSIPVQNPMIHYRSRTIEDRVSVIGGNVTSVVTPEISQFYLQRSRDVRKKDSNGFSSVTLGYFYGVVGLGKEVIDSMNWFNFVRVFDFVSYHRIIIEADNKDALQGILYGLKLGKFDGRVVVVGKFVSEGYAMSFDVVRSVSEIYFSKTDFLISMLVENPYQGQQKKTTQLAQNLIKNTTVMLSLQREPSYGIIKRVALVDDMSMLHPSYELYPTCEPHNNLVLACAGLKKRVPSQYFVPYPTRLVNRLALLSFIANIARNYSFFANEFFRLLAVHKFDVPQWLGVTPPRIGKAVLSLVTDFDYVGENLPESFGEEVFIDSDDQVEAQMIVASIVAEVSSMTYPDAIRRLQDVSRVYAEDLLIHRLLSEKINEYQQHVPLPDSGEEQEGDDEEEEEVLLPRANIISRSCRTRFKTYTDYDDRPAQFETDLKYNCDEDSENDDTRLPVVEVRSGVNACLSIDL